MDLKFCALIALVAVFIAAMLGSLIVVIVIGANLIGPALGSSGHDSADPRKRTQAMLRLVASLMVFSGLLWICTAVMNRAFRP